MAFCLVFLQTYSRSLGSLRLVPYLSIFVGVPTKGIALCRVTVNVTLPSNVV